MDSAELPSHGMTRSPRNSPVVRATPQLASTDRPSKVLRVLRDSAVILARPTKARSPTSRISSRFFASIRTTSVRLAFRVSERGSNARILREQQTDHRNK
jgi:hypothetical protein